MAVKNFARPAQLQPDAFDLFWDRYPRRVAKGEARRAWRHIKPDAALVQRILAAIDLQMRCKQWRDGYIPNPATWLRGERWDDEPDFYQAKL
jgi:hypothetical protein